MTQVGDYLDETRMATYRTAIDELLQQVTSPEQDTPQRLADAMQYSVLAPGKRLRPLLALLACEAISGQWRPALPVAASVELIHVYSLIHDDLPAMDNDDLRRGKPTCHKQFDEATAILAGDALQMLAIEVLCKHLPAEKISAACSVLCVAAGRSKLVGGQMDDLAAEGRFGTSQLPQSKAASKDDSESTSDSETQLEHLKAIHRRKTGALIVASLELGGLAGGASEGQLDTLRQYGQAIGLAFQIVDDCLDVESTPEQMGKNTRKDSELGKLTYPGLLGLQESKQFAEELISRAIQLVSSLGEQTQGLVELAEYVIRRNR